MSSTKSDRENFGSKAPIVEAMIDFGSHTDLDKDGLHAVAMAMETEFPEVDERFETSFTLTMNADGSSSTSSSEFLGFVLRHENRATQIRRNGFSVSHLHPYDSWSKLKSDTNRLWLENAPKCSFKHVHRIAVRYINEITLPGSHGLGHWLALRPALPSVFLDGPDVAKMRVQQFVKEYGATAIVTLDIKAIRPTGRPILLDIECLVEDQRLSPEEDQIWKILERLRDLKNNIFFDSLTDSAKELLR
jgi:uncharacterized protein (TIGR04255 family)